MISVRPETRTYFFFSKGHFWDSATDGKRNNVMLRLFEDSLRSVVTRQRLLHWRQLNLSHKERGAVVYFTKLKPGQGGVGGNGPATELLRSEIPSGEQSDLYPSKPNQNQSSSDVLYSHRRLEPAGRRRKLKEIRWKWHILQISDVRTAYSSR